jgi:hypothetical protein
MTRRTNHIVESVRKAIISTVFSFFSPSSCEQASDIERRTYESCRHEVRFGHIWGRRANCSLDRSSPPSLSSFPTTTHKTAPSVAVARLDVVLPSLPNPEDLVLTRTSSNNIPSSTFSHKSTTLCNISVTTSVLSTTSLASSYVVKATNTVVVTNGAARNTSLQSPLAHRTGRSRSQLGPVLLPSASRHPSDTPTSSLVEGGRVYLSTTSSPSPSANSFIAVAIPSSTSVDGFHTTPSSKLAPFYH